MDWLRFRRQPLHERDRKSINGNIVTFTADFYEDCKMQGQLCQSKTCTIEFYDGGYYYLSAVEA